MRPLIDRELRMITHAYMTSLIHAFDWLKRFKNIIYTSAVRPLIGDHEHRQLSVQAENKSKAFPES